MLVVGRGEKFVPKLEFKKFASSLVAEAFFYHILSLALGYLI